MTSRCKNPVARDLWKSARYYSVSRVLTRIGRGNITNTRFLLGDRLDAKIAKRLLNDCSRVYNEECVRFVLSRCSIAFARGKKVPCCTRFPTILPLAIYHDYVDRLYETRTAHGARALCIVSEAREVS